VTSRMSLEQSVLFAARDNGITSVLFRNAVRRRLGLNVSDSECLSYLSIAGSATPTELSRYTGLSTGSTTTMLDRLEREGFITRTPKAEDRRGVVIKIAPKWPETSGPLVAGVQKAHKELLAGYADSDLVVILDFLTRFTRNVVEHTKAIENSLDGDAADAGRE